MDKDRPGGRDRAYARELAEQYITDHPDEFTELQAKPFEEVVTAVEVFREAEFDNDWCRCEAWLLHLFPEPQVIGGELIIGNPTTEGSAQ